MADPQDPFAEFGGTAEPAPVPEPAVTLTPDAVPAPEASADPFAEFGGKAEEAFAEFGGKAEETPVAPPPEEPGFLARNGLGLDDVKYAVTHPVEALKGIGAAGQTAAEGLLSTLGVQTHVAASEAALPYAVGKVKDLLSGTDTTPTFRATMEQARKEINQRAEKFAPTAVISRFAGDTAAGIVTGGFGTAALGAKAARAGGVLAEAAPAIAKATSTAAKLLGPTVTNVVKAGIQLGAEGGVQGAEQAAATVIDQQIARGDFKGLGEKVYSQIPAGFLDGAKWNTVIGGATRLGLHGASRGAGKTGTLEDLKFKNAAAESPDVADVYDPNLPLRSSDLVDGGSPDAIAARQLTTPDVAKDVQADALPVLEKDIKQLFAIEDNHAKSVAHSAENAFDDVNVSNRAPKNLQTANVYDETLPLRASELVDNATPDVIAARKAVTPEMVEKLQSQSVTNLEKNTNRRLEIEAALDHKLRLRQKTDYLKTYDQPWQGDSFDDLLAKNGLDKANLEKLASDTQGEGGASIKQIIRTIDRERGVIQSNRVPVKKTTRGSLGEEIVTESSAAVPTQGQMIHSLDAVKRTAQKAAAKRGGLVHEALLEPTENLRLLLENPNIVPENAARGQQAVNAAWSPDIDTQRQTSNFFTEGRVKADKVGGDPYELIDTTDVGQLKGLVSNIGKEAADETLEEGFKARARQRINSFGERLRWGGDEPGNRKLLAEYAKLTHEAETELNKVALVNRYAEQAATAPPVDNAYASLRVGDRVNTRGISGLAGILNDVGTPVADSAEQGLKEAMRRKEASLAAGPAKEQYRALRIKVENQINRVALANKYAAETAKNPPRAGVLPGVVGAISGAGAASALGPLGASVGAGAGAFAAKKSADALHAWKIVKNADAAKAALQIKAAAVKAQTRLDKAARWQNIIEKVANPVQRAGQTFDIEEVKSNVEKELKRIDERQDQNSDETKKTLSRVDELTQHGGEELGQAYAEHLDARDSFLLEKAGIAPPTGVFGQEDRQLDDDTLAALHRYMGAADDPAGAIERLASGEATIEDQETLTQLYPSMLDEWRSSVVDQMAQSKKKPTYDEQAVLASMLGVDMLPDTDGDSIGFWQGLASQQESSEGGGGSSKQFKGQDVSSRGDSLLS